MGKKFKPKNKGCSRRLWNCRRAGIAVYCISLFKLQWPPATSLDSGTQMRTRYAILLRRRNEADHENNRKGLKNLEIGSGSSEKITDRQKERW